MSLQCSSTDSRLKRDLANSALVGLVSEKRKAGVETESGDVGHVENCFGENCAGFGDENRYGFENLSEIVVVLVQF